MSTSTLIISNSIMLLLEELGDSLADLPAWGWVIGCMRMRLLLSRSLLRCLWMRLS